MDLNLDNGDAVSLWSAMDPDTGKQRGWATILHKNGTQTATAIEPSLGASDEWVSEKSGNRYPTHWTVRIPSLRAVLDVKPSPREQEIISHIPAMTKYEGASAVTGTYNGKTVKGYCYVELVGFGSGPLT
jgi:predicted secreted hydrolase